MPVVTLLEKVYPPFSPPIFQDLFTSLCEGLKVDARVVGRTRRGWLQVEISGEDEVAAVNFLDERIGLAPVYVYRLERFSTMKGRILFSKQSKEGLCVDVGISSPRLIDARVGLRRLQAQLADGKKIPLRRLTELFCLHEHFPLEVKLLSDPESERRYVTAKLSEEQYYRFAEWIRSSLDRLIVLGATFSEVQKAIERSKHNRDVVKVEPLALLEHAVECKLGTDAVGLIPKLGPFLSPATLTTFSPREITRLVTRPF
ncbi:DUF2110 family protein [Candidatus Bathyarchaeota archaeon]|nr:DUF2110 family protein [Candidatus Bathyarchaeota archaeon]NIU81019.1 DUF2110 family protein [Candidatus Bathyarchaeota archaeon]NIV67675.1 DUF2110 family protein [Candidatus Bathyarchaeota archaeon]NIW16245.1 DUF2110 family protein [Candidatus Bathyarchaeota archaeon]NIW34283.1 DUF2110 family protein [Candidatus Bathyarchaeota archaeon]